MSFGRAAKIVFQQDAQDKMLPFTFDLQPKDLVFIDNESNCDTFRSFMSECIIIGIDTETKPMFYKRKRGESKNLTSIIQIAGRNAQYREMTFIVDLLKLNEIEMCMKALDEILLVPFTNEKCLVVGQGLDRDFRELAASYPTMQCFQYVNSVVETTSFVKCIEPEITYLVSLKYLVQKYLNCNLIKTQQTSNWGKRPLTEDQIHYAACDALVLLRLYDAMLCEAEVLSCSGGGSICSFTDNEEAWSVDDQQDDEVSSVDSAPSVEHSGATDKEDREPFSISSVLSVIDVSIPLMSRRRALAIERSVMAASVDPTSELVREYTKDWSSPAARQWYASQLVQSGSDVGDSGLEEVNGTKDDTAQEEEDQNEDDDVHIPLPTGLGKHQYFQPPPVDSVVAECEDSATEDYTQLNLTEVVQTPQQQPTRLIHIAKRRRSKK